MTTLLAAGVVFVGVGDITPTFPAVVGDTPSPFPAVVEFTPPTPAADEEFA